MVTEGLAGNLLVRRLEKGVGGRLEGYCSAGQSACGEDWKATVRLDSQLVVEYQRKCLGGLHFYARKTYCEKTS